MSLRKQGEQVQQQVGRFSETALPVALNGRFWSSFAMVLVAVAGVVFLLLPNFVPKALETQRPIQIACGVLLVAFGVLGFLYVNKPNQVHLSRFWARLAAPAVLLAGIAWVTWMGRDEYVQGVVVACVGLAGTIFAFGWEETLDRTLDAYRLEFGLTLLASSFAIGLALVWQYETLLAIGAMGVIVLIGALLAQTLLTNGQDKDRKEGEEAGQRMGLAEVRTPVTLSILAMFCGLLGLGDRVTLPANSILADTMEHFWTVLIAVVGFHFGSQAIEGAAGRLAKAGKP